MDLKIFNVLCFVFSFKISCISCLKPFHLFEFRCFWCSVCCETGDFGQLHGFFQRHVVVDENEEILL